jgi:hypothetical protein
MPRLFLFFFVSFALVAAPSFDANAGGGYHYRFDQTNLEAMTALSQLRLDDARLLINRAMKEDPGNNIPFWLQNYADFIEVIVTENEDQFKQFENNRETCIERLSKGDESSPYYSYCLAEVNLQNALARAKFREYITALREVNRSYSMLTRLRIDHPDFKPALISLGFLHTLIGSVPARYQWAVKILGFNGNVKEGIAEMHKAMKWTEASQDRSFYDLQCLFFMSLIYLNADSDRTHAVDFMNDYMTKRHLQADQLEPLQAYALAGIALRTGQNRMALRMLLNRKQGDGRLPIPYLDYMTGQALLADGDDRAEDFLFRYASGFKGRNFIKAAWQRLAWFHLLKGNPSGYRRSMALAGSKGNLDVDADKAAQRDFEKNLTPNPLLLRARLLSDGGYYDRAQKVLQVYFDDGARSDYFDLEAHYRQARIFDDSGETFAAIAAYQKVFAAGKNDKRYFAANSALKLGAIYERLDRHDMAALWYKRVQELDFSEYKNSITQKARAGYERTK